MSSLQTNVDFIQRMVAVKGSEEPNKIILPKSSQASAREHAAVRGLLGAHGRQDALEIEMGLGCCGIKRCPDLCCPDLCCPDLCCPDHAICRPDHANRKATYELMVANGA